MKVKKQQKKHLLDIENADKAAAKKVLYTRIAYGVGAIILFILLLVAIRRSSKKTEDSSRGH